MAFWTSYDMCPPEHCTTLEDSLRNSDAKYRSAIGGFALRHPSEDHVDECRKIRGWQEYPAPNFIVAAERRGDTLEYEAYSRGVVTKYRCVGDTCKELWSERE
jgi:hypothetical protein